jgi:hypothetical protein
MIHVFPTLLAVVVLGMEDLREKKIDGEVEYEYEYERVVNPVFQQMNLNRCMCTCSNSHAPVQMNRCMCTCSHRTCALTSYFVLGVGGGRLRLKILMYLEILQQ